VFHGTPAEETPLIAAQRRGHLDAFPGVDPVELVFIAGFAAAKSAFAPHARLDGGGRSFGYEVVSLTVKGGFRGCGRGAFSRHAD
jgi:hypothetical protein